MDAITIFSILWIALALSAGLLISKLMKKINFPNVTGYLIAGILIGPWAIGLIFNSQENFNNILTKINWISEIALGFIAFTIGGSFKLSALKKVGKKATIISIFEALGASILVIVSLLIAYICKLNINISTILIFGSIACATAPAATLLVINQYRAKGPVTETLIPVVAFDDAVALIAFSILFSIAKTLQFGGEFNFIEAFLIPTLEILISLAIGAILGFVIGFATRWFKSRHNRLILCIASTLLCIGLAQIDTKVVFGWNFSFQLSSLLTVMALGGVYINIAKGVDITNEYLDKFTSPIFMLFFIISGAKLNFGVFASNNRWLVILIALIYIISRAIGKWLGAMAGSKATKSDKVVQKYLGWTLIPQAGVALGLAGNVQNYFAINNNGNDQILEIGVIIYTVIIVSTMVYELTGPLITKLALTKAGEIKATKLNNNLPKAS